MSTIIPPPQVDREKNTDAPAAEAAKPAPDLSPTGVVLRLLAIEERQAEIAIDQIEIAAKVDALHTLLMGVVKPDGNRVGSLIDALHRIDTHLSVISLNAELVVDKHREYVNEVARVHHDNVRLRIEVRDLELRIDRIESMAPPAPNSEDHSEEE